MALIKELFKDKVRIVIILLGALLGFYLTYRHKPIESYSHKIETIKRSTPLRDIRTVQDNVLYLPENQNYVALTKDYLILFDEYYHRGGDIRDNYDITDKDYYKVMIYNPFNPKKIYKKWDVLKILRKDFPEEYVSDLDLDKDISGKSYLIVTTLITNSGGERDRIGRRRVFDFETGKFVTGVAIQGGVDKDDKQIYKRDYFSKSLNERLDYYGLRIRNRSNAVFLELSDPNTFRIRELNISSNKALMTILNKEVSGELVFFGDDALEQVSHLLAKPDQADMLSGTKLSASESKDGQEHDIGSLQDYNIWAR